MIDSTAPAMAIIIARAQVKQYQVNTGNCVIIILTCYNSVENKVCIIECSQCSEEELFKLLKACQQFVLTLKLTRPARGSGRGITETWRGTILRTQSGL